MALSVFWNLSSHQNDAFLLLRVGPVLRLCCWKNVECILVIGDVQWMYVDCFLLRNLYYWLKRRSVKRVGIRGKGFSGQPLDSFILNTSVFLLVSYCMPCRLSHLLSPHLVPWNEHWRGDPKTYSPRQVCSFTSKDCHFPPESSWNRLSRPHPLVKEIRTGIQISISSLPESCRIVWRKVFFFYIYFA